MLEFTGLGTVLRTLGVLYWALAGVLLVLALSKPRTRRRKAAWAIVVVAVFGFLPAKLAIEQYRRDVYAKEAWAYFRKKCETEAGEKIYKTFTGVKSVLVVKPLPPATERDLYDQFWYGDPYSASAHGERGIHEAAILASPNSPVSYHKVGRGFEYVELAVPSNGSTPRQYSSLSYLEGKGDYTQTQIERPSSRFAVSWEDISSPTDRHYWVAGSRLLVLDTSTNSVVGERIGFFIESGFGSRAGGRRPWLTSRGSRTTCPYAHDWSDRWFVLRVLNPNTEAMNVQ